MEGKACRLPRDDGRRTEKLGEQVDDWCDMIARAGGGGGGGGGVVGLAAAGGAAGPGGVSPGSAGLGPGEMGVALAQSRLAGLTLLPRAGMKQPDGRPTRAAVVRRKSSKKISATYRARDDRRKAKGMTSGSANFRRKHIQIRYNSCQQLEQDQLPEDGDCQKSQTSKTLNNCNANASNRGILENFQQVSDRVLRGKGTRFSPARIPGRASALSSHFNTRSSSGYSDTELDSSGSEDFTDGVSTSNSIKNSRLSGVGFKPQLASGSSELAVSDTNQKNLHTRPGDAKKGSILSRNLAKPPEVQSLICMGDDKTQMDSVTISMKTCKTSSKISKVESSESRMSAMDGKEEKKKKVKQSIIGLVKPLNQESEKEKFMSSENYCYNPQFLYKGPIDPAAWKKYFTPEDKLLYLSMRIMHNALVKHGSYENFARQTGGPPLTQDQILEMAKTYLQEEGLEDEVNVKLSADLVSRACMSRVKGRPQLQVQSNNVHTGWMTGLLRHEIGTHYLRSCNNRCQVWHKPKKRRDLDLCHQNPTEEGLASLHSVIFRDEPCLWRAAMLYYTVVKATKMSFSDLFRDLGKFVRDPGVKWDYCLRAKRGFSDTSQPGAFSKDQVYLKGALEILKNRKTIDFHALLRFGKVSYRDLERLRSIATLENTRIPSFMVDLEYYQKELDEILCKNGLTDEHLVPV